MTTPSPAEKGPHGLTRSPEVGAAVAQGTRSHCWGILSLHSAHSSTGWLLETFGFLVTQKTTHWGKKPIFLLELLRGKDRGVWLLGSALLGTLWHRES